MKTKVNRCAAWRIWTALFWKSRFQGRTRPIQHGTQPIIPATGKSVEAIAGQKGERLQSIQLGAVKRVAGIMPE